jgi:tRNA A37 N6-isopentenylltransferase MiaA
VQFEEAVDYGHVHGIISKHIEGLKYSEETLSRCTEQLVMDTKHYCKRQITWIRNRMFLQSETARQHFFVLDLEQREGEVMDIHQRFERQVRQRALEIIASVREHGFGHILE